MLKQYLIVKWIDSTMLMTQQPRCQLYISSSVQSWFLGHHLLCWSFDCHHHSAGQEKPSSWWRAWWSQGCQDGYIWHLCVPMDCLCCRLGNGGVWCHQPWHLRTQHIFKEPYLIDKWILPNAPTILYSSKKKKSVLVKKPHLPKAGEERGSQSHF